jgi:hypothetical protein
MEPKENIKKLFSLWPRLERVLSLLSTWDDGQGVLFVSHDYTAEELMQLVREHLNPTIVINLSADVATKKEWDEKVYPLLRKPMRQGALWNASLDRICLLAPNMDKWPESMHYRLKSLFELGKRPFCCLATTNNPSKIDRMFLSFFYHLHKKGGPRKPRDEK